MKFDTVIIGGGLAGLTAGIELASSGRKTAIVSTGQSAIHFSSGSMELMGYDADRRPVDNPLEAIAALGPRHPYTLLGIDRVKALLPRVVPMLEGAGIKVSGSHERNHWRLTPMGQFKPAWLTIEDYLTLDDPGRWPWKVTGIVNVDGFLDFYPAFIAAGLGKQGVKCLTATVTAPSIVHQRESTTEMRATNIARVLHGKDVEILAERLNAILPEAEVLLFPAVAGFDNFEASRTLRKLVKRPFHYVTTMGASVPGVRAQQMMQRRFRQLGGAYMLGDTVVRGRFNPDGSRLTAVETVNFGDDCLEADNFIFAAGSFFSHGLNSTPAGVFEPVLGLDVDAPGDRTMWFDINIFKPQPYMHFGISTDDSFRARRAGRTVDNILVAGASLPGADALREGSGAGISILTALAAADTILNRKN